MASGQSSFLTGGPTVGQLKTSLSHLEYENEQLKARTAKLEKESRSMENRLVQEQIDNGDLTARLDDARNLLRDRGLESDVKLGSRRRGDGDESFADDDGPRARTLPTGRATRQRRKALLRRDGCQRSNVMQTKEQRQCLGHCWVIIDDEHGAHSGMLAGAATNHTTRM